MESTHFRLLRLNTFARTLCSTQCKCRSSSSPACYSTAFQFRNQLCRDCSLRRSNSFYKTMIIKSTPTFTFFCTSASIRFSWIPQSPNPPNKITSPSFTPCTASSALGHTLLNGSSFVAMQNV